MKDTRSEASEICLCPYKTRFTVINMVYIIGSKKSGKGDSDILQTRISRRDFLKYMGATAASAYLAACTPEPPEPPQPNYIKVISSGGAVETLSNSPLSGNVRFLGSAYDLDSNNKPYQKSFDVEAPFGVQAYLGMMPEGSSATYQMEFTANDALKRIFKSVAMQGTNDFQTDLLKLSGLNYPGMRQYMTGYGTVPEYVTNKRWNVDKVDVLFNPNSQTGERLSQDYIDQVKNVILKMFSNSGGFIKSYSFNDGNKPEDPTVPPDGQIWVFYTSYINGVGGIDYPTSGDQVKSAKLLINQGSTTPLTVYWEGYNLFLQGVNDIVVTPNAVNFVDTWYRALFKRPISTMFYGDREEQSSFSGSTNLLARDIVRLTQDRTPDMDIIPRFGGREEKYRMSETHIPIDKREVETPRQKKILR